MIFDISRWRSVHCKAGGVLRVSRPVRRVCALCALAAVFPACAENVYTNHAGNVVSGVVIALDARTTTISNAMQSVELPLSIFPESEQRRIAADFGRPRIPAKVRRAIDGAENQLGFDSFQSGLPVTDEMTWSKTVLEEVLVEILQVHLGICGILLLYRRFNSLLVKSAMAGEKAQDQ